MDYSRWDIIVYLDFSEYISLFESFPIIDVSGDYNTRLLYNTEKPDTLLLSIYYDNNCSIYDRFDILKVQGINILDVIKKSNQANNQNEFCFENSRVIEFSSNPAGWEHDKNVVEITIDNIDILTNSSLSPVCQFHLTENSFVHIIEYVKYGYFGRLNINDKFIEETENRNTVFGDYSFVINMEHFHGISDKNNLQIKRYPYIQLCEANNKTDKELLDFGDMLCLLMSFFWNKRIDYFSGFTRVINNENFKSRHFFKYSKWNVDDDIEYPLKSDYSLFYDFIDDIDYEKTMFCKQLLNEIIPVLIQSKYVDDSSCFMLLFNLIEKVRNFCLDNRIQGREQFTIKDEYIFLVSKNQAYTHIKNAILSLLEIIDENDREEFKTGASDKINGLKKTGLKDQFNSLIQYLGIDSNKYNIDFKELTRIRNKLFHGSQCDNREIDSYNEAMRTIAIDLILILIRK